MKIIGLTGSIGMGKSTIAAMFAALGVPIFDADAAVHTLYAPGGRAVPLIRAVFPEAVRPNGSVDRAVLGQHMRSDPLNLEVLTSFIHPWVGDMRRAFLEAARAAGAEAVLFDIPLLFETGGESQVDATIVVSAPESVQRERVLARPGMTDALFESLLSRQMPDAKKRKRADYVISTANGRDGSRAVVERILTEILEK